MTPQPPTPDRQGPQTRPKPLQGPQKLPPPQGPQTQPKKDNE